MKNAFIFTVLVLLLTSSCTKTIESVVGDSPQQLVVFAEMEAGTFRPTLSVQSTLNNKEEVVFLPSSSDVQIFVNDNIEPLDLRPDVEQEDRSIWKAGDELEIVQGNNYRLYIAGEDFEGIEAISEVPFAGDLNVKNLGSPNLITNDGSVKSQFKFDFSITDNDENSNYYHLTPFLLLKDGSKLYINVEEVVSNENAVTNLSHRHGMLIDNSIVDEATDVSFYMSIPHKIEDLDLESMFVHIDLRTVPKDYFLYHRSISQNLDAGASVFNLPTVTHTNFSGGYGIFATYSSKLDSIAIN